MTSEHWWWIIALRVLVLPLFFGLGMVHVWVFPNVDPFFWLLAVLIIVGGMVTLASAVAMYFDKQHVATVSEWSPSRLYYLMALLFALFISDSIAIAYLYNRHKYVGTP